MKTCSNDKVVCVGKGENKCIVKPIFTFVNCYVVNAEETYDHCHPYYGDYLNFNSKRPAVLKLDLHSYDDFGNKVKIKFEIEHGGEYNFKNFLKLVEKPTKMKLIMED